MQKAPAPSEVHAEDHVLEVNLKVYQFGRNKSVPPLRLIKSLERPHHLLDVG